MLIQLPAPLTVKVGQGLALDGPKEFMALQTPNSDPKVGSLESTKPLLQDEQLPASGDEQRMDRESQPPEA